VATPKFDTDIHKYKPTLIETIALVKLVWLVRALPRALPRVFRRDDFLNDGLGLLTLFEEFCSRVGSALFGAD
jgi:hypothetical protein